MTANTAFFSTSKIPRLENGDRLTRAQFERRYHAMPDHIKAELIEGIVYIMASPLRITQHGEPHAHIMGWLSFYKAFTPNLQLGDNSTVRLDLDNEPQPDALLRIKVGGQSIIGEEGYVEGAPELIVEIAASSVSYDLHQKLKVYRRNGVQEYLVWRVEDAQLDWFRLRNEESRISHKKCNRTQLNTLSNLNLNEKILDQDLPAVC
ncbi:Uma2 family endonuclease [Gloeothece citriformis]|uniref:Uma2 family endonuclease n=1 Tax=Gloeothece citriformis TaxID=2546356 RepID=UPI000173D328|nr:Uma2 family endonuclease [Gloeothece citriformis]